jgi:hypothetical protein
MRSRAHGVPTKRRAASRCRSSSTPRRSGAAPLRQAFARREQIGGAAFVTAEVGKYLERGEKGAHGTPRQET